MDPRKPWKGKFASLKHKKMSTRQELENQNPEFNGGGGGGGESQNHSHFTSSIIWCEYYHRIIFLTCWVEIENMLSSKNLAKKPVASRISMILPTASSTADTIAFLTTCLADNYNYSNSYLFLSDPSPIIGYACHSLTHWLTHWLTGALIERLHHFRSGTYIM